MQIDPAEWPPNAEAIKRNVAELMQRGTWWIYKGDVTRAFEERFANWHDCRYGVSTSNGTVALEIALKGLGLGPGDHVVVPAYSYYAVPKCVLNVGATPLFVDVATDTPTLDVDQVAKALQQGASAVIAVHISGAVAALDRLQGLCKEAAVPLIEDCAQATGGLYQGRAVGSWGDVGVFSFGGIKLLTCGQGGMITTSDGSLYEKCYALTNRGLLPDGWLNPYGLIGDNHQLSDLAAVTLGPQLDALAAYADYREQVMRSLDHHLGLREGFTPLAALRPGERRSQMKYACYYAPTSPAQPTRNQLLERAAQQGIALGAGYKTARTEERLFRRFAHLDAFPNAQNAESQIISIHHTDLLRGAAYWLGAIDALLNP